MPDLLLTILRLIFLALIFLFVWQVARSLAAHLALGPSERTAKKGTRLVIVRSERQSGTDFVVNDVTVVGRGAEADFQLDDPYASEVHLRLQAHDGRLVLHDLGSTNGTYVNGKRVAAPLDLKRGDSIQVGKTVFEVR